MLWDFFSGSASAGSMLAREFPAIAEIACRLPRASAPPCWCARRGFLHWATAGEQALTGEPAPTGEQAPTGELALSALREQVSNFLEKQFCPGRSRRSRRSRFLELVDALDGNEQHQRDNHEVKHGLQERAVLDEHVLARGGPTASES